MTTYEYTKANVDVEALGADILADLGFKVIADDPKGSVNGHISTNGDKVKVTIMFRGRENTHPELGLRLLDRMWESLKDLSSVEKQPTREGARLNIILTPLASQKSKAIEEIEKEPDAETENT